MNPAYSHYTSASAVDEPHSLFLNPAAGPASAIPHAPPPQVATTQQFVSEPLPVTTASSQNHQDHPSSSVKPHGVHELHHDMVPAMHGFLPPVQYDAWSSLEQSGPPGPVASHRPKHGLSLSLSSQQQQGFVRRGFRGDEREVPAMSGGSLSSVSAMTSGGGRGAGVSVLLGSMYLKAAQELLEEVVNVGSSNVVKSEMPRKGSGGRSSKAGGRESSGSAKEDGSSSISGDGKCSAELSVVERQEIQMKKAKLITMLDEVEQRYRQYHHQMQIVISAFKQAAGIGSVRTYTALALQTISKQFRCLKDVISGQIKATNKSLGEDGLPGGKIKGSRLKFVDHHIRQQRVLQQLGMFQHNAWRPQRGLPEHSVSVLRAWLFEHFLHPYPKDSDKHMLAKKTGLTRSQVSNWFINARVRLWKPMVEEMYVEEVKDQEQNDDSPVSKSAILPEMSISIDNGRNNLLINQDAETPEESMSPVGANIPSHQLHGFSFIGSSELDGITQGASPKKLRNAAPTADMVLSTTDITCLNMEPNKHGEPITIMFGDHGRDGYSLLGAGPTNFIGGFGQYPIAEIGRLRTERKFAAAFHGNGVSLTLGLQHSENLTMPGGAGPGTGTTHPGFIPGQGFHLEGRMSHTSSGHEGMNMQNRKRFAAQLLPDFVT